MVLVNDQKPMYFETPILLFDGICNLCNSTVQFVIKRDTTAKFKFAALQSEYGQLMLKNFRLPDTFIDSFIYIKGDRCFIKSSAILHMLKDIGGAWQLLYIFIIVPRIIRDFCYDVIARSRYKIWGKRESCMIPTPDLKSRFLG